MDIDFNYYEIVMGTATAPELIRLYNVPFSVRSNIVSNAYYSLGLPIDLDEYLVGEIIYPQGDQTKGIFNSGNRVNPGEVFETIDLSGNITPPPSD